MKEAMTYEELAKQNNLILAVLNKLTAKVYECRGDFSRGWDKAIESKKLTEILERADEVSDAAKDPYLTLEETKS